MDRETSSMDESAILGGHPWMEKYHPWMKVSSVDVTDDGHGYSNCPESTNVYKARPRGTLLSVPNQCISKQWILRYMAI